jgi:geranylgeranyl diphosphate synthase, type II
MKPYTIKEVTDMVNSALASVEYPAAPRNLYAPVEYALDAGGKRLRPVLLMLVGNMFGCDTGEALKAALAIETYHNYTLMHDDLMDHADMRRGKPTVHKRWDANTAILSGDTMLVLAYRHLLAMNTPKIQELARLFTETAIEIGEGQQYDMDFESRLDVSESEYIEMIRLKTGVLIACAAKMGALIGGADDETAQKLYRLGETVGIAFQLQDDWLDVYGDPKVFGKKIGGDIACNKKTFLLIKALEIAKGDDRAELLRWMDAGESQRESKIAGVTAIYDRLGIGSIAQQAISRYFEMSRAIFDSIAAENEGRSTVWQFIESLVGRKN